MVKGVRNRTTRKPSTRHNDYTSNRRRTNRNESRQLRLSQTDEIERVREEYRTKKKEEAFNNRIYFCGQILMWIICGALAIFATFIAFLILKYLLITSPRNHESDEYFKKEPQSLLNYSNNDCDTICELSKCCHFPNNIRRSCLKVQSQCDSIDEQCNVLCKGFEGKEDIDRTTIGMITDLCNEDMMKNPRDIIKCSRLCAPRMCCFESSTVTNSDSDQCFYEKESCSTFSQCRILNMKDESKDESVVDVETVSDACSMENILSNEGYGICQRLCWKRACCFLPANAGGCYPPTGVEWCEEFGDCRNLLEVQPRELVRGNKA